MDQIQQIAFVRNINLSFNFGACYHLNWRKILPKIQIGSRWKGFLKQFKSFIDRKICGAMPLAWQFMQVHSH